MPASKQLPRHAAQTNRTKKGGKKGRRGEQGVDLQVATKTSPKRQKESKQRSQQYKHKTEVGMGASPTTPAAV